jgi:spermidine synthase
LSGTIIGAIVAVVITAIALFVFRYRMNPAHVALAGVWVMGFSQAGIQIALLFSFQIIYGNLYDKLGLLFTFFMLGLALSGWRVGRPDTKTDRLTRHFCLAHWSIAIHAFLFPSAVVLLSGVTSEYALWFGANIFFPALSLIAGLQGGALFALANKMRFMNEKDRPAGQSAGLIYGLDLLGSCVGAVVCAVGIIPVVGLTHHCLIIVMLNLSVVLPFLYRRDII